MSFRGHRRFMWELVEKFRDDFLNSPDSNNSNLPTFPIMTEELKRWAFTEAELDYLVCALIRYQSELRTKTKIMEAHASADHLANHRARLLVGTRLLDALK